MTLALTLAACNGGGSQPSVQPAASTVPVTDAAPTSVPAPGATDLEWTSLLSDLGLRDPVGETWRTVFETGFEDDADLADFYVTPQSPLTGHEVSADQHHSGSRAHHGFLTGVTGEEPVDGPNHRGYPTIQLPRRPAGACGSPCLIELWVRLDDAVFAPGEWISFATFTTDASDRWTPVVTVNVGTEGWLHLFHVPTAGIADRAFQRTDLPFPLGRWVRVTTLLDVDASGGAAAVWQDGTLVSAARVEGGDGDVDQMHFGLYAPPTMTAGSVWNDDIRVSTAAP